jgi:acyl-CoA reductase-like NAD-dependent aldehyde dehydrogenase
MSTERVLVQDKIADQFIEKLIEKPVLFGQVIQPQKTMYSVF